MFTSKQTIGLFSSLTMALMTGNSFALGVSDLELNSSLNQKLDAKIALNAATDEELGSLRVTIIPVYDDGIGAQQLKHELVQTETGSFLKITSIDAIKEPVLNFQLDLNWNNGQLVRDYTLLLDPPGAR